jgi:hypothetical protein
MEEECPHCKSKNTGAIEFKENGWVMQCNDCGKDWFVEENKIVLEKEIACIRALLERILRVLDEGLFIDYQMEKFGNRINYITKEDLFKCVRCLKPMKQIDEHTWKLDCECVEKYPELKNLRLSVD